MGSMAFRGRITKQTALLLRTILIFTSILSLVLKFLIKPNENIFHEDIFHSIYLFSYF